jgi:hypothetical protein
MEGMFGWMSLENHQVLEMCRLFNHIIIMPRSRLPKFLLINMNKTDKWKSYLIDQLTRLNYTMYINQILLGTKVLNADSVKATLLRNQQNLWQSQYDSISKLNIYTTWKNSLLTIQRYVPCVFMKVPMNRDLRSFISNLLLGTTPLKIETDRYLNKPKDERFCPFCPDQVENQYHFLFHCPKYTTNRTIFFKQIKATTNLPDPDVFARALLSPFIFGKYISTIWQLRQHNFPNPY